jgi:5-carboxymethyl-2-hydroxymuconate isomerase
MARNLSMEDVVPHMAIEYSANLDSKVDMDELCALVSRTILDTGLFEPGAVRVRAFRAEAYAVADRLPENGFIDMNFRIGKGRSAAERKRAGEAIFSAASAHLAKLFETPHFALSLEIREIDAELSWKKNAIHPRLRGK